MAAELEPISSYQRNDMSIAARKARNSEASGVSKKGPKLQPGARYACGKLKPESRRETGYFPAQIKRVVEQAIRGAGDPRLGTVAGVLHLNGTLTAKQFAAACSYARVRGSYDQIVDVPARSSRSPDYGTARAGSSGEPLSDAAVASVQRRYAAVLAAILAGVGEVRVVIDGKSVLQRDVDPGRAQAWRETFAGRRVALLDRVLLDDRYPAQDELEQLRKALDSLANHFHSIG